jgi:hypothetical protein
MISVDFSTFLRDPLNYPAAKCSGNTPKYDESDAVKRFDVYCQQCPKILSCTSDSAHNGISYHSLIRMCDRHVL